MKEERWNPAALFSLAAAAILVILKLGGGLITGSLGLISAGIESSGDVIAAILTLFAVRLGGRPADADHQYGHRRAENLAALGVAAILIGGGIVVVVEALRRLAGGAPAFQAHWYILVVIAGALAVDALRLVVVARAAARDNSAAFRANVIHFGSDIAGEVAVLAGLLAARAGFGQGDTLAALVVAAIIFAAAAKLTVRNAKVLMDTADVGLQTKAAAAVEALNDVELRRLRLRESGGRYFVDATVAVTPEEPVVGAHVLADRVEAAVHAVLPGSDVLVHLEPQTENLDLRARILALALAEPLVREAHDIDLYEHDDRRFSVSLHLKMNTDLPLGEAHEVAERVEAALRSQDDVADVHTHLEPLERPLPALPGPDGAASEEERIRQLIVARTGHVPRELLLLNTAAGPVVFVTVGVGSNMALPEAHELASRLEEDIRRDQPHMADVVVHTEP